LEELLVIIEEELCAEEFAFVYVFCSVFEEAPISFIFVSEVAFSVRL
jgi:hypothetical protein